MADIRSSSRGKVDKVANCTEVGYLLHVGNI
jgi:hypothetical protein